METLWNGGPVTALARRRHVLSLTDAGRRAIVGTEQISRQATEQLLDRLSPGEREALHALLLKALGEAPA